jgi:hypothetical protein
MSDAIGLFDGGGRVTMVGMVGMVGMVANRS